MPVSHERVYDMVEVIHNGVSAGWTHESNIAMYAAGNIDLETLLSTCGPVPPGYGYYNRDPANWKSVRVPDPYF